MGRQLYIKYVVGVKRMTNCYDPCNNHNNSKALIYVLIGALFFAVIALFIVVLTSVAAGLTGIQAQLVGAGGTTIADGSNVIFDSVLNNQSGSISYSGATGTFTVTAPGNYYVDWWVGTDGAGPSTNVSFAIDVNGVNYSEASSPIVSGQLSGEALVTVTTVPTQITLVNVTGQGVFVPTTPVQANIVITKAGS